MNDFVDALAVEAATTQSARRRGAVSGTPPPSASSAHDGAEVTDSIEQGSLFP